MGLRGSACLFFVSFHAVPLKSLHGHLFFFPSDTSRIRMSVTKTAKKKRSSPSPLFAVLPSLTFSTTDRNVDHAPVETMDIKKTLRGVGNFTCKPCANKIVIAANVDKIRRIVWAVFFCVYHFNDRRLHSSHTKQRPGEISRVFNGPLGANVDGKVGWKSSSWMRTDCDCN